MWIFMEAFFTSRCLFVDDIRIYGHCNDKNGEEKTEKPENSRSFSFPLSIFICCLPSCKNLPTEEVFQGNSYFLNDCLRVWWVLESPRLTCEILFDFQHIPFLSNLDFSIKKTSSSKIPAMSWRSLLETYPLAFHFVRNYFPHKRSKNWWVMLEKQPELKNQFRFEAPKWKAGDARELLRRGVAIPTFHPIMKRWNDDFYFKDFFYYILFILVKLKKRNSYFFLLSRQEFMLFNPHDATRVPHQPHIYFVV